MTQHPDVLILGGGVIGLTTAYFLSRGGARVDIVDRGDFGRETSWAGAGILSPTAALARARSPHDLLAAHSARLFPQLSAELREYRPGQRLPPPRRLATLRRTGTASPAALARRRHRLRGTGRTQPRRARAWTAARSVPRPVLPGHGPGARIRATSRR